MVFLSETDKCTGCMACFVGCPEQAITISTDAMGNCYPNIQQELCINCGKCQKICPELNPISGRESKRAYAVWSLDPECRKRSASGGAASEFYEEALKQGYWICGAEYTSEGSVIHSITREPEAIGRYRQSKYVFSEMIEVYRQIKSKLEAGEKVLVISLPCKVAGILGYLGKRYDNLLTADIVCHGTPPKKLLREHVTNIAPEAKQYSIQFREDNEYLFNLRTEGKLVYSKIGRTDMYLAAFLEGLSYRSACYNCNWAQPKRISDLTVCDFWGLGTEIPFDHPYTGSVSAVLINSEKGQTFFDVCRKNLFVEERPVFEAVKGNTQLNVPTQKHPKQELFKALYEKIGFDEAVKEILGKEIRLERKLVFRRKLYRVLRKMAGLFIKRYRG